MWLDTSQCSCLLLGICTYTESEIKRNQLELREHSGSMVECLTLDRATAGSSFTGVIVFCP